VYAIVDGCIRFDKQANHIVYKAASCTEFVNKDIAALTHSKPPNQNCTWPIADLSSTDRFLPMCATLIPVRQFGDWSAALRGQQIDLFIGFLTYAKQREAGGIRFTPGYLSFQSRLYVHPGDKDHLSLWRDRMRRVGVIKDSTNEQLLDSLIKNPRLIRQPVTFALQKETFDSFPALETAMDNGEIDAVLVDETFVTNPHWVSVDDLYHTKAWNADYQRYLGTTSEYVAMATMGSETAPTQETDLLLALRDALANDSVVRTTLIPKLCRYFWSNESQFVCGKTPVRPFSRD
jgi:hypothetical protein